MILDRTRGWFNSVLLVSIEIRIQNRLLNRDTGFQLSKALDHILTSPRTRDREYERSSSQMAGRGSIELRSWGTECPTTNRLWDGPPDRGGPICGISGQLNRHHQYTWRRPRCMRCFNSSFTRMQSRELFMLQIHWERPRTPIYSVIKLTFHKQFMYGNRAYCANTKILNPNLKVQLYKRPTVRIRGQCRLLVRMLYEFLNGKSQGGHMAVWGRVKNGE